MTNLEGKKLQITFEDGSIWLVDIDTIIMHRAEAFIEEFNSIDESIDDTIEYFSSDTYTINDWALDNMQWYELQAVQEKEADPTNYSVMWNRGETERMRLI